MKIILRAEAVELGLKKYFTGKSCKHGHISERYTKTRICIACLAVQAHDPTYLMQKVAREKKYNQSAKRKARHLERQRSPRYKAWAAERLAGPHGRAAKIKYRSSAKGKAKEAEYSASKVARASRAAYRKSAEGKAQEALWRASLEGRAVIQANNRKRQAMHRDRTVPLTKAQKLQVTALYEKSIRLTAETGVEHQVDHILPMVRGGLHHPDNLQVTTKAYNLAKKDLTEEEFSESLRTGVRRRVDKRINTPVEVSA